MSGSYLDMKRAVTGAAAAYAQARFSTGTQRSEPYKQGFVARLIWVGSGKVRGWAALNPFPIPSSDADAWWAGWDEVERVREDSFREFLREQAIQEMRE